MKVPALDDATHSSLPFIQVTVGLSSRFNSMRQGFVLDFA